MGETVTAPLTIVEYPHPALRKRAAEVTVFDDALRQFCQQMFATMYAAKGVGLAAPQVARSLRLFVTDHQAAKPELGPAPLVWINPRIEAPEGTTTYEEGCLSFPSIFAKVQRHNRFTIVAQNEFGEERRMTLDCLAGDFLGIVVQHELDHLDGRLFVDHLAPAQLSLVRRRLREMEKEYKQRTGQVGAPLRR